MKSFPNPSKKPLNECTDEEIGCVVRNPRREKWDLAGHTEHAMFIRTPDDGQTLLAAAALIENPRVILPDDKALAAKLRELAGEQT